MYIRWRRCVACKNGCSPLMFFELSPLNELYRGKLVRPLLFAVTLSIITSNIYTRLAACNCISITFWSGDLPSPLMAIFTNLFLWVPGLAGPKFFASQTRSSAFHIWGPLWIINFMYPYESGPFIEAYRIWETNTGILTYTIKIKLTLSCKIIFRAQVISLCSSNSACLQVYCWKLLHLSPWTYHINFSFYHLCTVQSPYFMTLQ